MSNSSTQTYILVFRREVEQYYVQKITADTHEAAKQIADMMSEDAINGNIDLPFSLPQEQITCIVGLDADAIPSEGTA